MSTLIKFRTRFLFSPMASLLLLAETGNSDAQTTGCYIDFSYQQTGADEFQFIDQSSFDTIIPPTLYFWDFGDGETDNISNPTHAYYLPGTYLVCLHVYNGNVGPYCCNDSICHLITTGKSTGLEDLNASPFQINLVNEGAALNVSFQLTSTIPVSLQAADVSGKIFYHQKLQMLSPGFYDLRIENVPANGMILIQLTMGNEVISRKWTR